jgi:hypothetical protein
MPMRIFCKTFLATIALVAPVPLVVGAQPRPAVSCQRSAADSLHGIVRGRVVDDSTGAPWFFMSVNLVSTSCRAITDKNGLFELTGVPIGEYRVGVGALRHRRFDPLPVTVRHEEPAAVEIRLRPENRVLDCLEIPECARLLNHRPAKPLTDMERLRESALRTALAILITDGWSLGAFAACVDEANDAIREALTEAIPKIVTRAECAFPRGEAPGTASAIVRTATGEKAVRSSAEIVRQLGDSASARLTNYVGPLSASGWICDFKRENGAWTAHSCRMTWIS